MLEPPSARHPVAGQPRMETGDSHLYISASGSESQQSGNLSVLPALAKPSRAPTAQLRRVPLPGPSFVLAPASK